MFLSQKPAFRTYSKQYETKNNCVYISVRKYVEMHTVKDTK